MQRSACQGAFSASEAWRIYLRCTRLCASVDVGRLVEPYLEQETFTDRWFAGMVRVFRLEGPLETVYHRWAAWRLQRRCQDGRCGVSHD